MKKINLLFITLLLNLFSTTVFLTEQNINSDKKLAIENDNDNPPLHSAAKYNNLVEIKKLIENGTNVDEKDEDNGTALHYAVAHNNPEAI